MEDIVTMINELINLGENRDELQFWLDMYPNMTAAEREKLRSNLANELVELKSKKTLR